MYLAQRRGRDSRSVVNRQVDRRRLFRQSQVLSLGGEEKQAEEKSGNEKRKGGTLLKQH